ncbi:hypothetical protein [Paraburkholderia sacchari]|uniref:Uncharacterized protein n=1 Tax=Paraburkholderia sacchari TaxID=159450 RepID=A0A8T6ZFL5_9BURK|nr:hypothetical protein [Paraburkholderia sacchari]NLP63606.1 hypothetical protein [Paraburkholderia sacchari]
MESKAIGAGILATIVEVLEVRAAARTSFFFMHRNKARNAARANASGA